MVVLPLLLASVLFVLTPVAATVIVALVSDARPGGFSQSVAALISLAVNSLSTSAGGSILAFGVALACSYYSVRAETFRVLYKAWLSTALFVNPLFLVLGLTIFSADLNPWIAVTLVTAYVVFPLGGIIVQSAFDQFPRTELKAVYALGGDHRQLVFGHIMRRSLPSIIGSVVIMTVYSLGFYLLPTYVGLGRMPTLAVAINSLAGQVGDWIAAQQLALVLMLVQAIVLVGFFVLFLAIRRKAWV